MVAALNSITTKGTKDHEGAPTYATVPSSWRRARRTRPRSLIPARSTAPSVPWKSLIRSSAAIARPSFAAAAARRSNLPTNSESDEGPTGLAVSVSGRIQRGTSRLSPRWSAASACSIPSCCWSSGIIGSSIFLTAKDIAGPLPQPSRCFLLVWVLGARDFALRLLRLRRTGIDVPRLWRPVHLSARSLRRPGRVPLRMDAVQRGQWRLNRGPRRSFGRIPRASSPGGSRRNTCVLLASRASRVTPSSPARLALIAVLTYVNVIGLRWGTLLQNVSTWTKFIAMAAFVILGFAIGKGHWSNFHRARRPAHAGHEPGSIASPLWASP